MNTRHFSRSRRAWFVLALVIALPDAVLAIPIYYTIEGGGEEHLVMIDRSLSGTRTLADGTVEDVSDSYYADYIFGPKLGASPANPGILEYNYARDSLTGGEGVQGTFTVANSFSLSSALDHEPYYYGDSCSGYVEYYGDGFNTCYHYNPIPAWDVGTNLEGSTGYYAITAASKNSPVPIPASVIHMLLGIGSLLGLNKSLTRARLPA